ncbi:MAG: cation:proton antiporter [Rhodocyclaceae bacterium]|jgi:Kef-type K+ transport system membrane component KefB|nr:cation:proton antiporter [Rhodocyclaceae bacterium]MBK6906188.1 cation:proton antiporter [Rhodocyclaceae bacterium]
MSLLTTLLVLVVVARLFGKLFAKYNQPEVVGEILAGVLLGPSVLNLIYPDRQLAGIADLAVFLVILAAGLEMRFSDIFSAMRGRGLALAAFSFFVPFLGAWPVAVYFELDPMRTIFLGLCVSITALPVAAKMLESMQILDSRIGNYAVATAILNDVAALLVLGVVLALPEQPTAREFLSVGMLSALKLAGLFALVLAVNGVLLGMERLGIAVSAIPERLIGVFGPEALFGLVVLFVLGFGSVSEALGFHFVIGAFFGALLIDKRHFLASRYEELKKTLASVTGGFLAPVFFAFIGLKFDVDAIEEIGFVLAVLSVSIVTKVFAGWIGGRWVGMSSREALGLGCMLNGRGIMELVVASIAYQKGFIGAVMFSTLVLMGLVTTLLAPFLFNRVMPAATLERYRQGETV